MNKISLLILILVITFLSFSSSLFNDFINWDDDTHLLENPMIRSLDRDHIKGLFTTTVQDTYIPLSMLSFAVEYYFWGYNPFVFHLNNLLLHLAVTALVFVLALRMGIRIYAAGLAALIFGIHPMHVESVAWIVERKDVLYSFFYMMSLVGYWRYMESKKKGFFVLSIFCGLFSILAKPMALSLPLILFLLDWLYGRKFTVRLLVEKIPYFLFIIPITWVTYTLHARIPGKDFIEASLLWVWTFIFYPMKFIFPKTFIPFYELPKPIEITNGYYMVSLFLFVLLLSGVIRFRKNRWFLFAVMFYFFSIFFLMRFDTVADVTVVADRFMYLPSLGLCLLAGISVEMGYEGLKKRGVLLKNAGSACVIILLAVLSFMTFKQCRIWKDNQTFWNHIIRHAPATIPYNNRGQDYLLKGEYEKALKDFEQAIKLNGRNYDAYLNRGLTYMKMGQPDRALMEYNKALSINDDFASAYNNRGVVYQESEQYNLAVEDFTQAIALDPKYYKAYTNRGNTHVIIEKYDDALQDFSRSLKIDPHNPDAHFGVGMVYFYGKNDPARAITEFSLALKGDPGYAQAYYFRFVAYTKTREYQRALQDAKKAKSLGWEFDFTLIEKLQDYLKKNQPAPILKGIDK